MFLAKKMNSIFLQMLLQQYIDGNWLQHSFQLWVEKCQSALSAESIELLKEVVLSPLMCLCC